MEWVGVECTYVHQWHITLQANKTEAFGSTAANVNFLADITTTQINYPVCFTI